MMGLPLTTMDAVGGNGTVVIMAGWENHLRSLIYGILQLHRYCSHILTETKALRCHENIFGAADAPKVFVCPFPDGVYAAFIVSDDRL